MLNFKPNLNLAITKASYREKLMINNALIIFSVLFLGTIKMAFAINQEYHIEGGTVPITNIENNNYNNTNRTVTINNETHKIYVDKSNKQYYKINGKFVPIINTEINTKK